MASYPNIGEATCEELIVQYTDRFFRRVYVETPVIPVGYDGKYVMAWLIATNVDLTDGQIDQLDTAITNITGVYSAFPMIGPARVPMDRVPTGSELTISMEAGFNIKIPE